MTPFLILLLVPLILQHIYFEGIEYAKKNRRLLLFFFICVTLLVALRHKSIGNDTNNYIRYFDMFSKLDWRNISKNTFEVGFGYLNKFVSLFSKNPQVFLAVVAIICTVLMYPNYKRLCMDVSLTVVLFCTMSTFMLMFSGIRQMLAISMGFVAYDFTRNKKLIPFILAVIVAMSFHTSAFMLAFMYPLYHATITKKWLYIVVPALAVIFIFNEPIFYYLSVFLERYIGYESSVSSTGAYTTLLLFVAFTVFAFVIPDESRIDKETIGLRNFLLMALVIQMFAPLHMLAMRMNYYYIVFIPLLLPKIIDYRSERWGQVAMVGRHIMVVFFLVYFFINLRSGGGLNVFPYHFFWETIG